MAIVYYCPNCKRLVAGPSKLRCTSCGKNYVSLGVDSERWKVLTPEQKKQVLNRRVMSTREVEEPGIDSPTRPERTTVDVSEKWIWPLATVGIVVSWITSSVLGSMVSIILTIVLNVIFLTQDIKELKESGYDPDSWMYMGFFLVPVYIFVRESKTNRNWAPGIVNCVLLFLDLLL